jgi:hypothetical protein
VRMERPPFSARNARERNAMIEWTHGVLDEYFNEYYYDDVLSEAEEECRKRGLPRLELPGAIKAARQGDVTYMRKLVHAEVAELIQPPKLSRGEKYKRPHRDLAVRETAKIVRRIWLVYYGRHRRRTSDGASAKDIAAAYHGRPEWTVRWTPGGKQKKPRRKVRAK